MAGNHLLKYIFDIINSILLWSFYILFHWCVISYSSLFNILEEKIHTFFIDLGIKSQHYKSSLFSNYRVFDPMKNKVFLYLIYLFFSSNGMVPDLMEITFPTPMEAFQAININKHCITNVLLVIFLLLHCKFNNICLTHDDD